MKTNFYIENYIGLNQEQIESSRKQYGNNKIETTKKQTFLSKILQIFREPMFLLLIITATIYFVLGEYNDGMIMLIFVFFVSGIELFQERKTDKALNSLKTLVSLNTKVIRDGEIMEICSEELVVGDIVLLEEGDNISADSKLLESNDLGIDESILTGESQIVYKIKEDDTKNHFKRNICYSGTNVISGSAVVEVIAVGIHTEYGKIGKDLNSIIREKTPLEKQVNQLIRVCAFISFLFCLSVFIVTYFQNTNSDTALISSILSGVTVAMATIPEEIPVILTVFLAMGAWKLVRKKTLVRNMSSVETLGAVSVLCVDKTGTLTKNEMELREIYGEDNILYYAALACETHPYDPMEKAILTCAFEKGIPKNIFDYPFVHEYSFHTVHKMMGHVWNVEGENMLIIKGACESVVPLCQLSEEEKMLIEKQTKWYAEQGYRVIAVGNHQNILEIPEQITDNKLHFLGLLAFMDPPRDGIETSIQECYQAGIRIIMITGDSGETAKGIACQIGLRHNDKVITGIELEEMSDLELQERVKEVNVFARVYPTHKMRIVEALQKNGEVVAMTGDGVNDAPALKKAEIGIAMGKRGTNVAKEASDLILLDDNFNTIVNSVKNGRRIYQNIRKAICYIFVIHIPIALLSFFVPLLNATTLLLPIHIVLLELIIDPTSSILFERFQYEKSLMKEKPRKIGEALIPKKLVMKSIIQGFVIFLVILSAYLFYYRQGHYQLATTFALSILILSNILLVYVNQSNDFMIKNFIIDFKDRVIIFINFIIICALLLMIYVRPISHFVGFVSLSFEHLLWIIILSVGATGWYEIIKLFHFVHKKN